MVCTWAAASNLRLICICPADGMARSGCATEPRLGALLHSQARAAHHAVQAPQGEACLSKLELQLGDAAYAHFARLEHPAHAS
jgi:hypothetical protein